MVQLQPSSAFDFAAILQPGNHVAWPQGTGEPTGLTARLLNQADEIAPVTLVAGMVTTRAFDSPNLAKFNFLCLNGASGARKATALSNGHITPVHLSAIPQLILSRRIPVDVALVRVRPTDNPDIFSLGVMVDFVHEMIRAARIVVAELDERMPETCGDTLIARESITHLLLADGENPIIVDAEPNEIEQAVARRVVNLIPDRATVQFGVGGMPVAVARALEAHQHLGLHSGIITDAAGALIEAGVITNRYKGVDEGHSVTGGLFGTKRLFDLAHRNDLIRMKGAHYTHAARTMLGINAFHTVNSAIAIDLSGQVNAEMAGTRYLGAVGGQVDFVRGARLSPGGRSIVALTSTTPDGKHSKIVPQLGAQPVTTARSDIDLVVTEHGVADLWGLDLAARAKALIAIAAPQFREGLLHTAFSANLA